MKVSQKVPKISIPNSIKWAVVSTWNNRYFIADFLIRSIIRTRLFNDYLGSLTNTPVFQRLPQPFNDYNGTESYNPPKTHKTPPQNYSAAVRLCAWTAEKPYIKRFSGIEKVHRNSIKITVDLWWSVGDSNPWPQRCERCALPTVLTPQISLANFVQTHH